jgi:hypothetical protein
MGCLAIAFVAGVVGGIPATFGWSELLHRALNSRNPDREPPGRIWWIPATVGVFERTLAMTFVLWLPAALGGFMAAWIAVKAAGGWANLAKDGSTEGRAIYFIGLLGSVFSFSWAIAPALIVASFEHMGPFAPH